MSTLSFAVGLIGAALPAVAFSLGLGAVSAGVLYVALSRRRDMSSLRHRVVGLGVLVAVLVFAAIAISQAYVPVEYGTVALVARFGGLTGQAFQPGLHWRLPFVDRLVVMPTVVQSYETSDSPDRSGADFRDYPVTAQTIDGQQIDIKYTALFRIPASQAVSIADNIGNSTMVAENIVKAYSRNLTRLSAQNYTAEELYSGEGIFTYEEAVRDALGSSFDAYGIELSDFLVRKIDFDEDYIGSIEQQQIAQEDIKTAEFRADAAEYEKQRQIRLSEAEAERTRLLAEADSERQRLLADAEAYGIETRGAALKIYPELAQWEFVRNLTGVQWGILPSDGVTPLVPVPSFEGNAPPLRKEGEGGE